MVEVPDDVRALRWACQAWRQAKDEADRKKHAVDAARVAWRLGADAHRVAEVGLLEVDDARALLDVTATDPALVVEESFTRWIAGDRDGALGLLHPHAQIVNHPQGITIDGVAALRARIASRPRPAPQVTFELGEAAERDGTVLVTADAIVHWPDRDGVDRYRPGWVCTVTDGAIRHVEVYLHEDEAREAAGFGRDAPRRRALGDMGSWRFAWGARPGLA